MNNQSKKVSMTIIGGFLVYFGVMGLISNCISLYVIPITADLGISRAQFSLCQSAASFGNIVFALVCSRIYKRISPIRLMRVFVLVGAVNCFLVSVNTLYPLLVLMFFINGFVNSACCTIPVSLAISSWLPGKSGKAIGIAAMGSGIGGMIANPVLSYLITNYNWQTSFRFMGITVLATAGIAAFFLMSENSEVQVVSEPSDEKADPSNGRKISVFKKETIILAIGYFMVNFGCTGVYSGLTPHVQDVGYAQSFAALAASGAQLALALGKIIVGAILDRVGVHKCLKISIIANVVGTGALIYFLSPYMLPAVYISHLLAAPFGSVCTSELARVAAGDHPEDKAAYMGKFSAIGSVNGIVTPILMGAAYDSGGSYIPFFWATIVIMAAFYAVLIADGKKREASAR